MSQAHHGKTPGAPFSGDPRDTYVAPEDVNTGSHYVMYSVFTMAGLMAGEASDRAAHAAETAPMSRSITPRLTAAASPGASLTSWRR